MNRCSFCAWIPILPWPVWLLAGQFLLGQNTVVGSMMGLLALCGSMPRGVYLGPHFRYKCASPRLSADLPLDRFNEIKPLFEIEACSNTNSFSLINEIKPLFEIESCSNTNSFR